MILIVIQTVADYLGANRASYCDFMCQPVAQNDDHNADTEPQTQEDEYIDSIADPESQTELRWQKYNIIRQGAWGDNIVMQAISDMLSVTINVRVLSGDIIWGGGGGGGGGTWLTTSRTVRRGTTLQ